MNRVSAVKALAAVLAMLLLAGCLPSRQTIREAVAEAEQLQDHQLTCDRRFACAIDSPVRVAAAEAVRASTPEAPRHRLTLLEGGQDALLARVHLIRAARRSIDVQSFIFAEDDSGYFVLNELLTAARRGVRVRVLLDQLFSVEDTRLLAALARAHVNFELRLYNPTFGEARTGPVEWVAGILCCFSRFNQRMHNKLLLIDGLVGVTGGRNYQDRYFDWDPEFNYRDRDVLVGGPVARDMKVSFEIFWRHQRSVPVAALRDVRRQVQREDGEEPMPAPRITHGHRIVELGEAAEDAGLIRQRLLDPAFEVGPVEYISDLPNKAFERNTQAERDLSKKLQQMLLGAERQVVLQTPYLVISGTAREVFETLHERDPAPDVIVSTNSLASTDAFPVYALSHKYKRRYLRELGFRIFEYKPFPAEAPIDLLATGALQQSLLGDPDWQGERLRSFSESARTFGSGSGNPDLRGPLPLQSAGVRISLHSKSLVIDGDVAMIGSHNFDPRSDNLNTESALIVYDATFAAALRDLILIDTQPHNAWTIAPRPKPVVLSGLNYSLGKAFEILPLFDFWPWRYATSYEMRPGCAPLRYDDPGFAECYEPVGDFPEVDVPLKSIYTRIITAFGAGLAADTVRVLLQRACLRAHASRQRNLPSPSGRRGLPRT